MSLPSVTTPPCDYVLSNKIVLTFLEIYEKENISLNLNEAVKYSCIKVKHFTDTCIFHSVFKKYEAYIIVWVIPPQIVPQPGGMTHIELSCFAT